MTKGVIARLKQFLLLSQCFQKSSAADASKCVYRCERVKTTRHTYSLSKQNIHLVLPYIALNSPKTYPTWLMLLYYQAPISVNNVDFSINRLNSRACCLTDSSCYEVSMFVYWSMAFFKIQQNSEIIIDNLNFLVWHLGISSLYSVSLWCYDILACNTFVSCWTGILPFPTYTKSAGDDWKHLIKNMENNL